ncbi:MAG TPA: hypothetical protein V6D00_01530 [Pantanalinema sp.]
MDTTTPPFASHPDYPRLMTRLREELELGNHYLAGMAFAIVEIEDAIPLQAQEAETMRERLLKRAQTATERSIRLERGPRRKVADFAMRFDRFIVLSLGSVDKGSLKVPLARIAHQMRNEFYATQGLQNLNLRRTLTIGVAHWIPAVGFITEQAMMAKAWQAFLGARAERSDLDAYRYLGLSASNLDVIRLGIFDWEQSRPAAKPQAKPQTGALSARPAVVARTAADKPEKKGWQFWK